MCLDNTTATWRLKQPLHYQIPQTGYKVFSKLAKNTFEPLFKKLNPTPFKLGEEYYDHEEKIIGRPYHYYHTGYHIFVDKFAAESYRADTDYQTEAVVQVEYNDLTAEGNDNGHQVVVARTIKLIKEIQNV